MEKNKDNAAVGCSEPDEENIYQSFICCVCLDLLYKPVVLACGHVSCFWCCHKSMNALGDSTCPICRHPYHHFPTICQMLHFLIKKMYPHAYTRRENQTFEEEEKIRSFSPQIKDNSLKSDSLSGSAFPSVRGSKSNSPSELSKLETPQYVHQLQDGTKMVVTKENNQSQTSTNGTFSQISIRDVQCPACKELLFRPAVLNCGHVYCETCFTIPEEEVIICQICQSPHPSDFPKVCLELSNFLEETFPKEYASRRDSIEHNKVDLQQKNPSACSSSRKSAKTGAFTTGELLPWLTEHGQNVHLGVGCDYCGIFPIVGDRYRCKDCKEDVGFDLCGECYNTQSKRPGRFNQQHTADHKFELIKTCRMMPNWMLRLISGSLEEGSISFPINISEDSEDDSTPMRSSNDAQENADNNTEESAEPMNNSMGDQNNNIQSSP